jgi:hypothetical protein
MIVTMLMYQQAVVAKKRTTESTATAVANAATAVAITSSVAGVTKGGGRNKPILFVLPGASGTMSQDMMNFLIPELHKIFDVRIREKKEMEWMGFNQECKNKLLLQMKIHVLLQATN